jgi:polyferredoxin
VYTVVLWTIIAAAAAGLWLRIPLKVDVIRDRAAIAREVEGGAIENVYRLQIMNTAEAHRTFEIRVEGLPSLRVASETRVELEPTSGLLVPVRARIEPEAVRPGTHPIVFHVVATDAAGVAVREKSVFIVR